MSARLTPRRIAERELWKLTQREERLLGDLQAIRSDRGRWQSVLDALIDTDDSAETDEEDPT